jgi:hypothetical protein
MADPNQAIKDAIASGRELTDIEKKEIQNNTELLKLYLDQGEQLKKNNEEYKKSADYQAKRLDNIRAELALLKDINIEYDIESKNKRASAYIKEQDLKTQQAYIELEQQREITRKAFIKANETADDNDRQNAKEQAARLVEINNLYEKENNLLKNRNSGNQAASQILDSIGVKTEDQFNVVEKGMQSILEGGEGLENFATSFGKGLTDKFSASNVAISLLSKTFESTVMMVKMADQTFASFNKAIGTTGELNNEIYELSSTNAKLGFTLQETAQAYTALAGGFVDFRGLSQQNRIELAQTVAELQAIGISSDIATKNISFFSKAMGLSTQESISLSKELVATAGALDMAPSKISSDFAAAASSMVVYGNRAIEVFKGLEAASKASGVEVSNLISIASKMDSFQGAAEVAGRLNAVLGGGLLNSSQLLMASEEERIRLVIESVQSQGVQFNDLDKYTQKAIANAAGITDMAEANKLFGMSLDVYDDYVTKTTLASEEQAKLEERIQASKSAQEKLTYIVQSFAVAVMPILNAVTALVDVFMDLNGAMGGTLPLILTIGASLYAFPALLNPYVLAIMAVVGLIYLIYQALYNGENSVTRFLDKFILLKIALYTISYPIILAIEQFRILYYYISFVAKAVGWLIDWIINLKMFGGYSLKESFIGLGEALRPFTEFVEKLYEFHKGSLKILETSNSLGELISSLGKNFEKLGKILHTKNSPELYTLADYMAAGFTKFAEVIKSLAIPALNMFMAPLKIIGSLMSGVWSGISTIVGATSQLFGKENVVGIKANFDATEMLATTAAKITPDSMTNVKQLAAEVQKFNMELKTMATVAASEPLENLAKAISATNQQITNQVGKVILEGREVGKFILDTFNKKGNIDTVVKSTSTNT